MQHAKPLMAFKALKYTGNLVLLLCLLFAGCKQASQKKPALSKEQQPLYKEQYHCRILFAQGKYDSAVTECKKILIQARATNNKKAVSFLSGLIAEVFTSQRHLDSAIVYLKIGEANAIKSKVVEYIVGNQVRLAEVFYDAGKPDSVNVYKNKMSKEADTMKNIPMKMRLLEKLADIYGTTNQPEKALTIYFHILEYARKKKDSLTIGVQLSDIGEMYARIADYTKAIEYAKQAVLYLDKTQPTRMVTYNDLGSYYIDLKQYGNAIGAFQNSIAEATRFKYFSYVVDTYVSIASPLIELKQYDKASSYLDKAMAYYTSKNYESGFMYVLIMKGKMERNRGHYQASMNYFEKALEIAKRTAHYDSESYVSGLLADVAGKAGLYEKAYKYEAQYNTVRDSIEKATSKKNIADLEIKYQTNEKEQRIVLLNQQDKLKDIELLDQKRKWWLTLMAVAFLAVTAFLLYRSFRIKRDSNKLLEEKNSSLNLLNARLNEANSTKTRLFNVLTHDLRAPISNLFLFLTIQKNHSHKLNPKQQKEHNERLIQSSENLMETMEDLLIWSKSQMESFSLSPEKIEVQELINYAFEMHRDHANGKHLTLETDCADDMILLTDVNFLKIVLRNIISNAIKFTPAGGSINIAAERAGDKLRLKVADTGAGMTREQIDTLFEWNSIRSDSSGMGLRLAKEFVTRLSGEIEVESALNAGTTFIITVPGLQKNVDAKRVSA